MKVLWFSGNAATVLPPTMALGDDPPGILSHAWQTHGPIKKWKLAGSLSLNKHGSDELVEEFFVVLWKGSNQNLCQTIYVKYLFKGLAGDQAFISRNVDSACWGNWGNVGLPLILLRHHTSISWFYVCFFFSCSPFSHSLMFLVLTAVSIFPALDLVFTFTLRFLSPTFKNWPCLTTSHAGKQASEY